VLGFRQQKYVVVNACPELCTHTQLVAWSEKRPVGQRTSTRWTSWMWSSL